MNQSFDYPLIPLRGDQSRVQVSHGALGAHTGYPLGDAIRFQTCPRPTMHRRLCHCFVELW